MTPAIAATFALAAARTRAWLADRVLGPKCHLCRERFRGWRTLLAHHHLGHADEPAAGDRL